MKRSEKCQALVEYALIIALVAIVAVAALAVIGPSVGGVLGDIGGHLIPVTGGP